MIIDDLEDAIIERITAHAGTGAAGGGNSNNGGSAAGKLGYSLTVGGYGGEFDSEADLEQARVKFPCALILLKEIGRGTDTGQGQKVPVTFTIFVAAQNRRNERARRRGAVGAVGSYQIAWDIRQLLKGQMLGFDDQIDELVPGPVSSILNGTLNARSVSVYACDFSTIWYEDLTPLSDDIEGEFLTLDVAWDFAPHGNVTPPLPAAEADARDIVKPREVTP